MATDSKEFIIENGVLKKYIGNSTVVRVPDGVKEIEHNAFDNTKVKELIIPGSVSSIGTFKTYGLNGLYLGRFPLEKVTILDGTKRIEPYAFRGYDKLKEITLPNSIIELGTNCFDRTGITELIIPGSVSSIGTFKTYGLNGQYLGNFPLKKVTILDGTKRIEPYAFKGYDKLKEVTLPNSIIELGTNCFDRTSITELIIPGSVSSIGTSKTYGLNGQYLGNFPLEKVTILDGVKRIEQYAFKGYKELKELNCYSPTIRIEDGAFDGTKLEKVNMSSNLSSINGFSNSKIETLEISSKSSILPKEYLRSFPNLKEVIIPESIKTIDDFAFYGTKIKKITLPKSVTKIESLAFASDSIEEIEWTPGIDTIDKNIFFSAKKLKKVYLPDNIFEMPLGEDLSYDHDIYVVYNTLPFNMKYFEIDHGNLIYNDQLAESILVDNADHKEIITELLKTSRAVHGGFAEELADKFVVFRDYIMDLNYENVAYNIDLFKEYGLSNEEIVDIINNNIGLRTAKISSAFKNFEYLLNERIIPVKDLKKVYFEDCEISIESLMDSYKTNKKIPELFNSLCADSNKRNQLELRDRLVSASTLNLLTDINDEAKLKSAKRILNRTNMQTIIESDNMRFNSILSKNNIYHSFLSSTTFLCIKYPVYEKLTSFNKELFKRINNLDEDIVTDYTKTLPSYNSWDFSLEKANEFKNEFCGTILYGTIIKMFDEASSISYNGKTLKEVLDDIEAKRTGKGKINEDLINLQNLLANYFETVNIEEVIKNVTTNHDNLYTVPYSDIAVKLMLRIDPYSFDMLRSNNKYEPSTLELQYAEFAKKSGYLFDEETESIYLSATPRVNLRNRENKLINYIEYINNQISINKIPKEEKHNYIKNVRAIVHNYIQTSSETELFKLYRAIDLFLRSESEYIVQKEGAEELAKDIFDVDNPNFDNNDRLLYSMYNLNRLAHDTVDISLKGDVINNYRIDLNMQNSMNSAFTRYLKAANILANQNMSLEEIFNLIDTRNFKMLFDASTTDSDKISIIDNSRVSNETTDAANVSKIVEQLDRFKPISKQINPDKQDEINEARNKLSYIADQYTLFFETKNIIQEEMINKFSINLEDKLADFNIYDLNTIEKKQDFYKKYGFIMEIQTDRQGNLLLAVYSNKFNEPFSLHMQNISQEVLDKIDASGCLSNKTIAHCKLDPPGLTDISNSTVYSFKDSNFITSGGFSNMDEGKCLLHNYLLYDAPMIKEKNNIVLDEMLDNINNNPEKVNAEEILNLLDNMSVDLRTSKFDLTKSQQKALNLSSLLVDIDQNKKVLNALKGIKKEEEKVL
ncbi:MAG: leucine-rich repeat protein [Bacilli bacterium]|nr:leucine-rich repeat protein [Bacilli bacterium]